MLDFVAFDMQLVNGISVPIKFAGERVLFAADRNPLFGELNILIKHVIGGKRILAFADSPQIVFAAHQIILHFPDRTCFHCNHLFLGLRIYRRSEISQAYGHHKHHGQNACPFH
ncbi:hypothetical protein D3C76_1502240 [compost metagenome]